MIFNHNVCFYLQTISIYIYSDNQTICLIIRETNRDRSQSNPGNVVLARPSTFVDYVLLLRHLT